MRIQHNIMAMNAYRNYTNNTSALSKNLEKLSSGYKINRAGDDAAGLAISEKMRAQITGLEAAQKNVKDGISLVKTAEGALQEVQDMLNRMVYLATQSANGTYDNEVDRNNLQKEVDQLRSEINRISDSSNFNGIKLLDGSLDEGKVTTRTAASAISSIATAAYTPKGVSDAFDVTCVTIRPEAASAQSVAEFKVCLDDIKLQGLTEDDGFAMRIGGVLITAYGLDVAGGSTAGDLAVVLATAGCTKDASAEAANGANAASGASTYDQWTKNVENFAYGMGNTGNYVAINGHIWKMSADKASATVTFTQVDYMDGGDDVTPDYEVEIAGVTDKKSAAADYTGSVNPQVQVTKTGLAVGSSQQAQAKVYIDFSKLKDGDTLTAGSNTYIFAIGEKSTYTNASWATDAANNTLVQIDLTKIFKTESDLLDDEKQAKALNAIVYAMDGTRTWTAGDGGVSGGVGTITFQSKSGYTDDTNPSATPDASSKGDSNVIGAVSGNDICDMRSEISILKQFYGGRQEAGAKLSFNLDVTKIKAGDTFTLAGKTFEFTDGPEGSNKSNIAVDLSTLGITGGILSSQTAQVMKTLTDKIDETFKFADGSQMYQTTVDGNKVTLTSNEYDGTTSVFEKRTAATMRLPTVTSTGKALTLQIGDTSDSYNQLPVSIGDIHCAALKISDIDISSQEGASSAVDVIKNAINTVSSIRGTLGATQNRLEHTQNNLSVMAENIQDAESTIRDTDVAEEMMSYVKNNILVQSAQAMLAQANQVPQGVLQLLG